MQLAGYLSIVWRRKWVVILTLFMTVAVVAVGTSLITPTYRAQATIRVATSSGTTASYSDYIYADRLLNTYAKIAVSRPVLEELAKRLQLSSLPAPKVEILPTTELIQIIVENPDRFLARDIANSLAEILIAQSRSLYTGGSKSTQQILKEQLDQIENELSQARQDYDALIQSNPDNPDQLAAAVQAIELKQKTYSSILDQYEQARVREEIRANTVSLVEPAIASTQPNKPKPILNGALAIILGLIAGVGLAFLFENLDNTLYTSEQIEGLTQSPLLGKIPIAKKKSQMPTFKEAFRRLRTNLLMLNHGNPPRTILLTSAQPGEGKSTIASHLANSLGQAGKNVAVVDCDMRQPALHKHYNLTNRIGLSSVLKAEAKLEEALQNTKTEGVQVLTSGPLPYNPVELLGSPEMKSVIEELEKQFDIVLLDAPALLPVTDAAVLSTSVDSVLVVVKRTKTQHQDLEHALKQLEALSIRPAGVVINKAEVNGTYYYYHNQKEPADSGS